MIERERGGKGVVNNTMNGFVDVLVKVTVEVLVNGSFKVLVNVFVNVLI